MGDHRLPKKVMSGELENAEKVRRGGRRRDGQTAWQRVVGCLASRGIGTPPHKTLGFRKAQYAKGGVGS